MQNCRLILLKEINYHSTILGYIFTMLRTFCLCNEALEPFKYFWDNGALGSCLEPILVEYLKNI